MRKTLGAICAVVLAAALVQPALAKGKKKNIVDVATKAGVFSTLLTAATAAGFADDLTHVDGLTVLAPTDEAFGKLPVGTVEDLLLPANRERLRAIIAYHIIPDRVQSKQIKRKYKLVETLNGCERVQTKRSRSRVLVDGVEVIDADIKASNGYIHVIDQVLLPERNCP
jgi:uncharacterized surface protein with fasciclin (FAS1) repeats